MKIEKIRNFCIIAHIDHGKSTLADRFLETTGTVEKRKMRDQLLDQMELERERGITIKLQPVRMEMKCEKSDLSSVSSVDSSKNAGDNHLQTGDLGGATESQQYILNLIDTPGHVDFSYEVSRSLAAVEGAVLLVDATKGVQAQTLSNLYQAIEQGLEIIPVVNKIDLPNANAEKTKREIKNILGCQEEEIILASGKTGQGVKAILERIIKKVPTPVGGKTGISRALIFDSKFDPYKGVLAYVRVFEGEIGNENRIFFMASQTETTAIEVGYFRPELTKTEKLSTGEIGYIATGLKSVSECRVGDTIVLLKDLQKAEIEPLPGYREVKPMVYAGLYPSEGEDYSQMRDALEKLKLNDAAFVFEPESNLALGRGFRGGFLGLLHLEIIQQRLKREFSLEPAITTPSVVYEIKKKGEENKNERTKVYSAAEMPDPSVIEKIFEPYVKLEIVTPSQYLGSVMEVMKKTRAEYKNTDYLDEKRMIISFLCPLVDVIVNLHDEIKSASSGYASIGYEFTDYRLNDLCRLDILVAGEKVEALSRIVPRAKAYSEGRQIVGKLKEVLPRQNFPLALQAAVGSKIMARETLKSYRKDVTAKLYGGDVTRKRKLLEKQKKGKKKMVNFGKVSLPTEVYLSVLKR